MAAVGAVREPRLDALIDGRHFVCWVLDHGPGGMLGQVRDVIRAEAGAAAPDAERRRDEELHRAALEAVRAARPARGAGPDAVHPRATSTRRWRPRSGRRPRTRCCVGWSSWPTWTPTSSHDQAMARLAVSRATYYRYLRQARARVAAALVDRAGPRLQT